jgi:hypothetical protein
MWTQSLTSLRGRTLVDYRLQTSFIFHKVSALLKGSAITTASPITIRLTNSETRKTLEQLRKYQTSGADITQVLRDAERIRQQRMNSTRVDSLMPNLTLSNIRGAGTIEKLKIPAQKSHRETRNLAATHNRT